MRRNRLPLVHIIPPGEEGRHDIGDPGCKCHPTVSGGEVIHQPLDPRSEDDDG